MSTHGYAGRSLLAVVLLAAVAPWPTGPASASCAAPTLEVDVPGPVPRLVAGETLVVTGRAFVDGCDDVGSVTDYGLFSCQEDREVVRPLQDVALSLRQGGRVHRLGEADAGGAEEGELGQVRWEVELPPGLRPGRAVLRAASSEPLDVVVRAPGGRRGG